MEFYFVNIIDIFEFTVRNIYGRTPTLYKSLSIFNIFIKLINKIFH